MTVPDCIPSGRPTLYSFRPPVTELAAPWLGAGPLDVPCPVPIVSPVVPLFTAPLAMPAPRSGRLALLEVPLVGLAVAGEIAESPVVLVAPVPAFCASAHEVEKMTATAAAMIALFISGLRHGVRGCIADAINIAGDPMPEARTRFRSAWERSPGIGLPAFPMPSFLGEFSGKPRHVAPWDRKISRDQAEAALRVKQADLIAAGRKLLDRPNWPMDVHESPPWRTDFARFPRSLAIG